MAEPPPPALSVVLPTWNEADNLRPLLAQLRPVLERVVGRAELIVVDAGSHDDTVAVARAAGCRVLVQRQPGYGGALRTGFAAARAPWILTLDADLSHPPAFIADMWAAREGADLVIASRYVPGGRASMPRGRLWLSRTLNTVFGELLGLGVRDLSSGFRLYRREALAALRTRRRDFDVLQELLVGLLERGGTVREVPFHYAPRVHGASHARVFAFGRAYARLLTRMWLLRSRWLAGRPAWRLAPFLAALAFVTALAHLPGLAGGALRWDDDELVFRNPALAPLSARTLVRMFDPRLPRAAFGYQYTPLSDLSYALDRALWGLQPAAFHLHNLGWQLLAVLCAFGALHRWRRNATAALWGSGLLALHPVAVEAVAWISGRRTTMALALLLASAWCWLAARADLPPPTARHEAHRAAWPPGRARRALAYAGSLVFALLALLSKQQAVALPAVLLVLDRTARRRSGAAAPRWANTALRLAPHAALALTFAAIGLWVGRREAILAATGPTGPVTGALLALPRYAAMLVWPLGLRPSYAIRLGSDAALAAQIALAVAIVLALAAAGWRLRRREPAVGAALLVALLVLLPALAPGRPQFIADRYLVPALPWLGAALGAALALGTRGSPPLAERDEDRLVRRRAALLALTLVLGALLAVRTAEQSRIWRSDLALWRHAVAHDPDNAVAARMWGLALLRAGRPAEALAPLRRAWREAGAIRGARASAVRRAIARELAAALRALGREDEARAILEQGGAGANEPASEASEHAP
ncbi:MAG: glycosyltransferase [Planctomycetota bacterium]|nr:MAG: glycosyltransferase [Planctomycetota bacterium]